MGLGVLKRVSGMAALSMVTGVLLLGNTALAEEDAGKERDFAQEYPEGEMSSGENAGLTGAGGTEENSRREYAQEEYPLLYGTWAGPAGDAMELWEIGEEYEVLPGDSLWHISEKLWEDGWWYGELLAVNEDMIENPELIYPGMRLQTGRRGCIVRKEAKYGGMQMGDYSMDVPGGWTVGTVSSGEAWANFVLSGEGFKWIAVLVQDKSEETVQTTQDWKACTRRIRDYVGEHHGGNISDLTFEHYRMGEGEEIFVYSFLWQMDFSNGRRAGVRACMGMKLTGQMQAEFLGFSTGYDIHGAVRYVAASFEEKEGYDPQISSVNDSNMSIQPQSQWELEGMLNPFSWVEEFFTALIEEAEGTQSEPKSTRDGLMDRISRPGGRERRRSGTVSTGSEQTE